MPRSVLRMCWPPRWPWRGKLNFTGAVNWEVLTAPSPQRGTYEEHAAGMSICWAVKLARPGAEIKPRITDAKQRARRRISELFGVDELGAFQHLLFSAGCS